MDHFQAESTRGQTSQRRLGATVMDLVDWEILKSQDLTLVVKGKPVSEGILVHMSWLALFRLLKIPVQTRDENKYLMISFETHHPGVMIVAVVRANLSGLTVIYIIEYCWDGRRSSSNCRRSKKSSSSSHNLYWIVLKAVVMVISVLAARKCHLTLMPWSTWSYQRGGQLIWPTRARRPREAPDLIRRFWPPFVDEPGQTTRTCSPPPSAVWLHAVAGCLRRPLTRRPSRGTNTLTWHGRPFNPPL